MNNKPVKLGLVGLHFGELMIKDLQKPENQPFIEIAALCDRDEPLAKRLTAEYGIAKYYTSLETLLADPGIEAVGLFTAPEGRAKLIDQILDTGRDVLTTKPFERSSEEARRILQKARSLGRTIHLNSPAPTPPEDIRQIDDLISQYHLGRPIAYRASTWCRYREQPDGSWYDDPNRCPAAPIYRLGIYLINDISRYFGEIENLQVFQSCIFTERPTSDNAQLSLIHKNGSIGSIFASFCIDDRRHYLYTLELNFENGTIFRNCGVDAVYGKIKLDLSASVNGEQVKEHREFGGHIGEYQYDQFNKAVRGGILENPTPDDQIINGIKLIEML
ncbi:MAG TPA: Gfo/Idh/MocA family oxidoreductase [Oscillospiraceae bacterium]|nr:Gfo/Idh/MocA family oxidoreductase [Oscillospiraceae bacterium]HPF54957.1 Gfo/Idh/MocA family oxidoreductase [Clostridiales bacterium]HPK34370.1 Gfo/Idh/MocA family oxidoreductase [Oscillospiraceae bacterium]HPR75816.1 Gfo/Idh/MocA family oxidoreductase [Oscillospiraceae bacterium]